MRSLLRAIIVLLALVSSGIAFAQAAPSDYTTGYRFDVLGQLTGVIKPDPDGGGSLHYAAERYTYDADGLLLIRESGELASWQSQSVAPSAWSGFTVLQATSYTYDGIGRRLTERVKGSNGTTYSMTQFSYDAAGRLQCSTVRMNESLFASPPASACSLGAQGSSVPDRITKNVYDAAGQLVQVREGVGTAIEQAYATYSFTANGKQEYVIDANGNRAKLEYDGFDRQAKWIFPSATLPAAFNPATPATALATAGSLNASDFEEYGYDPNGNRESLRKRDGTDIAYSFDALNRMTIKNLDAFNERSDLVPADERDVYYAYDLRGLQTAARFDSSSGPGALTQYDGFGRIDTSTNTLISTSPQLAYQYDANGNRTRITHPGGVFFDMVYDDLNRLGQVKKGATVLVDAAYSMAGRLDAIARYSSAVDQAFGYDNIGRLGSLGFSQGANSSNVSWSFTRNPASQIATEVRTNDAYAWAERVDLSRAYSANGLNQYAEVGGNDYCYDLNGNLTDDGINVYKYDVENRLVEMRARTGGPQCPLAPADYTGTPLAKLTYDPMGRLHEALKYDSQSPGVVTKTTRFVYDGDSMVLEYDGANAIVNRYVHGSDAKADDPLVWYEGSGTADSNIRNLYADPRGSIVLVMGSDGITNAINTYDEWGVNAATNLGRFQYTGQVWLDEIGMYYYKARIYSPALGRFLQVDPIGYEGQVNHYAYTGNDPVNFLDPTGMEEDEITVTGVLDTAGSVLIPGYDLGACALVKDCSASDWAWATVDIVPIGKLFSKGRKAYRAVSAVRRACGCFVKGTVVATPEGLVAIETLEIGDMVLAYNEASGEIAPKRVTDLIRPDAKPVYELRALDASGGEEVFHVTDDHPWKIRGQGWIETVDLKAEMEIETASVGLLTIQSIGLTGRVENTFNLTIEDWHTFLVGDDQAIVHNAKCRKWKDPKKARGKGERQMEQRGWTYDQIEEAIDEGKSFPADNLYEPANGATRYVHPETGRSVVIDNKTGEIIQVGGDGFGN